MLLPGYSRVAEGGGGRVRGEVIYGGGWGRGPTVKPSLLLLYLLLLFANVYIGKVLMGNFINIA